MPHETRRRGGILTKALDWMSQASVSITDDMSISLRRRLLVTATAVLLLGAVGALVAPVWGGQRAVVRIVKAPPARTTDNEALFRFKTRATRTWCRRDKLAFRRCLSGVKYSGLRPGRHKFTVRARYRGRTTYSSRSWTVLRAPRSSSTPTSQPVEGGGSGAGGPAEPPPPQRRLILDENFDGSEVDATKWARYESPGHAGYGLRRPSAFSLDGQGHLVVTAQMVDGVIVSGGMASRLDFQYGRVEFRVKTEPDPTGTMSGVVLTWPKTQSSPEFTENDIYETGPTPNNTSHFETFIHFGLPELGWQKWLRHDVDPSQWHTVAMEWHPDVLEIWIDDALAWSITDRAVIPDILHHVCVQLDARANRTLTRPVRMWLDYVRVYQ